MQMGDLGEVFEIRAHPSRRRYARISNQMHSSSGSTERSEAPWASSDQPNARGFSPNSLNKQASRCSPVPGAEYQARIRKSAKTITIIRSREHSDPGLGKDGLQLVPLGAPISTGARSEGSILSHPQATCLRCSVVSLANSN